MKEKLTGIYALLSEIPIMRGAAPAKLREVLGRLRLDFRKVPKGEAIVTAGQQTTSLICTLSGTFKAGRQNLDGSHMLFPETLFGLKTYYPQTLTAQTDVSIVEIPKDEFRKLLNLDPVFLLNYLNAVCSRAQR